VDVYDLVLYGYGDLRGLRLQGWSLAFNARLKGFKDFKGFKDARLEPCF
jgi:hypothetical protein